MEHDPQPQDIPDVAKDVFGTRVDLAAAYNDLLATIGSERGFIGPREVPRLWERHLLNCAVIGEAIDEGARVIDVGSGAGLPGIPLAIARPDLEITLVEPLLKRSNFLRDTVEELGLSNVTVIRGRAEEGPVKKQLGRADVVTSRAVAPLGKLARWSLPLARKGGAMLAMKGASASEEIERDRAIIERSGGAAPEIITVGTQLSEPTTLLRVVRKR